MMQYTEGFCKWSFQSHCVTQNLDYPLSEGCGAGFTILINFLCVIVKINDRLGTLSAFSAVGRIVNSSAKIYLTA